MKITNQTLFAGNGLLGKQEMTVTDRIAQKKQLYQKQAMHFVTSSDEGTRRISEKVEERKARIERLYEECKEANDSLRSINEKANQAKADYQVEDDSQEQKDLELMQKCYDIQKHGSKAGELSEEEMNRLKEMGEPTEYQKYAMELYEQADYWKEQKETIFLKVNGETAAIRSIKIEQLKSHAMVDAQKAKDELLAAASKEAVGMLMDDAKSQMDEKAEEIEEAAKEKREKEEEQEERIEAAKENRNETEAMVENAKENIEKLTEQAVRSDGISQEVNEQIKKILEEEKLLEEELKGLSVDIEV